MSSNGLTTKQKVFVEQYLKCWNATEAARRAGYAHPNSQAGRLLLNVVIKKAIKDRIVVLKMSADEVLTRLAEQARADYSQYIKPNGVIDLPRMIEDGKAHLIQGTKWDKDGHLIIEFPNSQSALVHLGKVHALFTDKIDASVKVDGKLVILPAKDSE